MACPKKTPIGRPSLKGRHRKPRSRLRKAVSLGTKVEAVEFFIQCNGMPRTLQQFFSHLSPAALETTRKLVYDWRSKYATLKALCRSSAIAEKRYIREQTASTVLSVDMENEIVQWINALRKEGVPVSALMLKLQGLPVAQDHSIQGFQASWSWRKGFIKHHGLAMRDRTRQGQVTPVDAERVACEFTAAVAARMKALGVSRVYNADQTAAFFEYLPKKTVSSKGTKTVWIRCGSKEKERATVMLTGDSDGNKYTAFVVHKKRRSKKPETHAENVEERHGFSKGLWLKEIKPAQERTGMQVYCNATAWWNDDLHVRYLKHQFASRSAPQEPILLMIVDFSGHWTAKAKAYASSIGVHLIKVPPCYTAVCQPADISWNRPFKTRLRSMWMARIRNQVERHQGGAGFKLKPPTRDEMTSWIQLAWEGLSATTIASGFANTRYVEQDTDPIPDEMMSLLQRCNLVDRTVSEEEDICHDDNSL